MYNNWQLQHSSIKKTTTIRVNSVHSIRNMWLLVGYLISIVWKPININIALFQPLASINRFPIFFTMEKQHIEQFIIIIVIVCIVCVRCMCDLRSKGPLRARNYKIKIKMECTEQYLNPSITILVHARTYRQTTYSSDFCDKLSLSFLFCPELQ